MYTNDHGQVIKMASMQYMVKTKIFSKTKKALWLNLGIHSIEDSRSTNFIQIIVLG